MRRWAPQPAQRSRAHTPVGGRPSGRSGGGSQRRPVVGHTPSGVSAKRVRTRHTRGVAVRVRSALRRPGARRPAWGGQGRAVGAVARRAEGPCLSRTVAQHERVAVTLRVGAGGCLSAAGGTDNETVGTVRGRPRGLCGVEDDLVKEHCQVGARGAQEAGLECATCCRVEDLVCRAHDRAPADEVLAAPVAGAAHVAVRRRRLRGRDRGASRGARNPAAGRRGQACTAPGRALVGGRRARGHVTWARRPAGDTAHGLRAGCCGRRRGPSEQACHVEGRRNRAACLQQAPFLALRRQPSAPSRGRREPRVQAVGGRAAPGRGVPCGARSSLRGGPGPHGGRVEEPGSVARDGRRDQRVRRARRRAGPAPEGIDLLVAGSLPSARRWSAHRRGSRWP